MDSTSKLSEMMSKNEEILSVLMPISTSLLKDPSRKNVAALFDIIQTLDPACLQELSEYIIFPLFYTLRLPLEHQKKHDLLIDTYRCLQYFLSCSVVSRWELFRDMFHCITCKLGSPEAKGRVSDFSEEFKLASVLVLQALIKCGTSSIYKNLYSAASLPPMGHAVSVLLCLTEHEHSRELQTAAMNCLLQLSQADNKYKDCTCMYGDVFASFLPGISKVLCRVVKGDSRQGQVVITKALEVWCKIVCLVVGDAGLSLCRTTKNYSTENLNERIRSLVIKRTEKWEKSTTSNLLILVKMIAVVKTHTNWHVRTSLVKWSDMLLKSCSRSMKESVPVFLEVLVGLLNDEYDSVSCQCRRVLTEYNTSCRDNSEARPLTEILEENLYILTTSLPRQIRMADEEEKRAVVNLLGGYLSLLGPNVNSLLRSFSHLKRLSLALVQSLELDCTDMKIIEERMALSDHGVGLVDSEKWIEILKPRKFYQHFRDENVEKGLFYVCNILGRYGDINILVDNFLDLFQETQLYRLAVTLIINEIVAGTVHTDTSRQLYPDCNNSTYNSPAAVQALIKMLTDEYLSSFNLLTCVKEQSSWKHTKPGRVSLLFDERSDTTWPGFHESRDSAEWRLMGISDAPSVTTLNTNILQICLLIEGIGTFAKVLGEDFKLLLIKVLYPLMEKLGDRSAYISSSAYLTLIDICHACHYRCIEDLIMENVDYLVNEISLRLRHLPDNLHTPLVLQVMLQYSSEHLLPIVHDTVQEVLSSLDDHHTEQAELFMKVLSELTKAVVRWFPRDKMEEPDDASNYAKSTLWKPEDSSTNTKSDLSDASSSVRQSKSLGEIRDFFLDYHKQKQVAKGIVSDDEIDCVESPTVDDDDGDDDDYHTKQELPKHVVIVKEVLVRSKHLLTCGSTVPLRLLVLDTMSDTFTALQDWNNELLPLVHQVWQPFSLRFDDEEKLVSIRAMSTLRRMAEVCGDFIQQRTIKDVFPKIIHFLSKQTYLSIEASPAYQYTVIYKYQLACLSHIGYIALQICASGVEVEKLSKSCLPYLSARQCKPLQEASMTSIKHLIELEPEIMWLSLHRLYSPSELRPPASCFKPIKISSEVGQKNEFTDNVTKLLQLT